MSFTDAPEFDSNARDKDGAIPRFYMEPFQNNAKTAEMGQPVFEEREMVEILIPGDRRTVATRIVLEEHRRRWPRAYAAFRAGQEAPVEGIPLEEWPGISRGYVEELKFAHVRTVQQLAALPDEQLNKSVSMGGFSLREKARRYLEQLGGQAPTEKLAAENAELKGTISTMKGQMDDLVKRLDAMSAHQASVPPPTT